MSQDTETDVNLDLESISKEDDESLTKSKLYFSNVNINIFFI